MNLPSHHLCLAALGLACLAAPAATEPSAPAANAVNALGLDLLAKGAGGNANALLSPYSIQSALAMTFAGAAGDTRTEMARVLHFPDDENTLHQSFADLRKALLQVAASTAELSRKTAASGGSIEPLTLSIANRLFGQQDYEFRKPFLDRVKDQYDAPLQLMDFIRNADQERQKINRWVEEQTRDRIRDLIPPKALSRDTRLVLVNAIHLKVPWADKFPDKATKPLPFLTGDGGPANVPTMRRVGTMGYAKRDGYQAITIPYVGGDMQLLVLLPDANDGLAAMEAKLTPEILAACANPEPSEIDLSLPKFKLEPPLMELSKVLIPLGIKSAFDRPQGSADFDRMAPRKPDDYLFISEVFHKTFLALDENGTEAAAATAVVMDRSLAFIEKPKPTEVRVDHPFLFAIQHRPSGACLFLGRITDPR